MQLFWGGSRARLPSARYLTGVLLAAATCWVLGNAGLPFSEPVDPYVSPVWPFAGFALALILTQGYHFWPAILLSALAVNLQAGASWPMSGGMAVTVTLSAVLAVYLLRRYTDFRLQLVRLRDIVNLIVFGALLYPAISATLSLSVLWLGGMVPAGVFRTLWLNRWVGGAVGVLVVTPFFLAFITPVGFSQKPKWYAEALVLLIVLAAVSAFVFTPLTLLSYAHYPLAFAPLPLVIWAAVRFEVRGAAVASLLLAAVSLLGTLDGHGPFASFPRHEGVLLLAAFNGIVAATGMVVAGAVAEMRRERSLRSSPQVLQQAFDLIPVGLWITDERGRITFSNPEGRRIWGRVPPIGPNEYGECQGWRLPERTPIEAQDWALARAVEKGETRVGERIEIAGFDGERRVIRNSAMPLRNGASRIVGAISVNEDITELVRGEQHLRELATIVEQTEDIVIVTDRSGAIEYVNFSFARVTGYSRDEVIGKRPAILKSGEHDQAFYKELWDRILSGAAYRHVVCNRKKTGELYYEEKTISPIRDAHGEITNFVSTGQDITERKRLEQALFESEARCRRIFENVPLGIVVIGPDGQLTAANPAWERMSGYDAAELPQLNVCGLTHPDDRAESLRAVARANAGNLNGYALDKRYLRRNGEVFWGRLICGFLRDERGAVSGRVGIIEDITEAKETELRRAEQRRNQRDALVREVHHRIKNHLQGVAGLLERRAAANRALEPAVEELLGQLNGLATVHGLQSESSGGELNLCDVARSIVHTQQAVSSVPLEFALPEGFVPVQVNADEAVPIALILNELVSNALKHLAPSAMQAAVKVEMKRDSAGAAVCVRNAPASLPPGFDFADGRTLGTGLRLAKSLLPGDGARLSFSQPGAGVVEAVLELWPPVLNYAADSAGEA